MTGSVAQDGGEDPARRRIGVYSGPSGPAVNGLLNALERALAVRFEQVTRSPVHELDGALVLDPGRLEEAPTDIPRLVLACGAGERESAGAVALAGDLELPRPLRGRVIPEDDSVGEIPFTRPDLSRILAARGRRAVWWESSQGPVWIAMSAYPIPELGEGESLRDHLRAGRFMGLLPVLCFLWRLCSAQGWTPPPLRACFVVDDPNLHWRSYGFINYDELALHASEHGYHVALATVPLDGWLVNRHAASLFKDHQSELSLLMHGNDHVARELGRLGTDREAEAAIGQALGRVAQLERRAEVRVDRVMAPPHGACSEAALRAMFRLGMEAACISRPFPWRDGLPAPTPLAGWRPAELVAGGLPVLPRHSILGARDDLAFRALLGQPLILYGHHKDMADGLDVLSQAAQEINALGDVEWSCVGRIARRNYATRRVGETLLLRVHARHVEVAVPDGVRAVRVIVDEPFGGFGCHRVVHPGGVVDMTFQDGLGSSDLLPVQPGTEIELTLAADHALEEELRSGSVRPWPLTRRILVEGRDRVQPLLRRG